MTTRARRLARELRRFIRTPKGTLTLLLVLLIAAATTAEDLRRMWPGLIAATLAAAAVDLPILRWRKRRWEFPSGAVLTGMLVGMVMSPHEPWHAGAVVSAVAIALKYVLRTRAANIFNPAALALVGAYYAFDAGHSWWGALPDLVWWVSVPLLVATGGFITERVNKLPLVLAFLAAFYALFTTAAFLGDPSHVAEVFIPPDVQAVLFFAFFILTDPPTSPTRDRDQIICGMLVAAVSYATYELAGVVFYPLAGVLAGNVYEAARRTLVVRGHTKRRTTAAA